MTAFFGYLFGTIITTLKLAAVGAVIGVGAFVLGRTLMGISGYIAAAAFGAVLIIGVYGSGYLGAVADAKGAARIAQLEAEKANLEHEMAALNTVRAKEQEQLAKQVELNQKNDEAFAKLNEIIDRTGTTPECPGIAAFANELEAINKLE